TTEGMSGSLKEGTIVETEEESGHGVVETDNNTTEGMSGSLKEGTIVETEENGCNGIVEIDKNKQEKSKDSNSVVNNKNEDKKDNLSKQNTSINKLKESPATGDENIIIYIFSILMVIAFLLKKYIISFTKSLLKR
ncbi:hypothetical protein, partial [Clostridioides difficile]